MPLPVQLWRAPPFTLQSPFCPELSDTAQFSLLSAHLSTQRPYYLSVLHPFLLSPRLLAVVWLSVCTMVLLADLLFTLCLLTFLGMFVFLSDQNEDYEDAKHF